MHPLLIAKLILLLSIANGTPVLIKHVFGGRMSQPIDGGLNFFDGRPLFGPAKTIRGAMSSIILTTLAGPPIDIEAATAAIIAGMAMVGDLFSSFIKRRLDFASSSRATGLDQIPESLFPLLVCYWLLSLTAMDIVAGTAVFSGGAIVLSPLFHRAGIRDRPF